MIFFCFCFYDFFKNNSLPNGYEVVSHTVLILISLIVADFEHLFIGLLASPFIFFSHPLPFFPFSIHSPCFSPLYFPFSTLPPSFPPSFLPSFFPFFPSSLPSLKDMIRCELTLHTQGFVPSPFSQNPN